MPVVEFTVIVAKHITATHEASYCVLHKAFENQTVKLKVKL